MLSSMAEGKLSVTAVLAPLIATFPFSADLQGLDDVLQSTQEQHYCQVCINILYYDLNSGTLEELGYEIQHGESSFTLLVEYEHGFTEQEKQQCPLREFIHQHSASALNNYRLLSQLGHFAVVHDLCRELVGSGRLTRDTHCDVISGTDSANFTLCSSGMDDVSKPQRVSKLFDACRAKLWLNNCKAEHGATCYEDGGGVEGMKLIDCERMLVVNAEPSWPWLALSYVWGGPELTPFPDTPRTISDAITVTKQLGYRYLWADQYCIDQDDAAFKKDQIGKMDKIYRAADVTIVAAMGDSKHCGLPGVSFGRSRREATYVTKERIFFFSDSDPESDLRDKSPWYQRAWTYQEGYLSRRLLVFTEEQTAFYCKSASWMESWGGIEHMSQPTGKHDPSFPRSKQAQPWSNPGSLFQISDRLPSTINEASKTSDQLYDLLNLLSQYTHRALSFDSDALNAFSGVMQHLRRAGDKPLIYDVCGLPFIPNIDIDRHQTCYIFIVVSWSHSDMRSRRRPQFPSWTWAGWTGGIHWPWDSSSIEHLSPMMRNVTFGLDGNDRMTSHDKIPRELLRAVTAIGFEAPTMPASEFSVVKSRGSQDPRYYIYVWGKQASADYNRLWPQVTPENFVNKLSDGSWSCIFLGSMRAVRILLVVEWQSDGTAIRIGSVDFNLDTLKKDPASFEWRTVTLA